jgi:hypothetical protein
MTAPVMKIQVSTNCIPKSTFVNGFLFPNFTAPFRMPTTLNFEIYREGYMPEAILVRNKMAGRYSQNVLSVRLNFRSRVPQRYSNPGINTVPPKISPSIRAKNVMTMFSDKN